MSLRKKLERQRAAGQPKPRERSWEEYGYYEVPGPGGGPSRAAWERAVKEWCEQRQDAGVADA